MDKMQTMISKRGQTVVPAVLRRKHKIEAGDRLVWIDDGETIKVVPVSGDSVRAPVTYRKASIPDLSPEKTFYLAFELNKGEIFAYEWGPRKG